MSETTKNWAIFTAATAVVAFGIYGFYHFAEAPFVVRLLMVLAGLVGGAGVAYVATPGKDFVRFARESFDEMKKVAWPTRKETVQMTLIVFAFAVIMSLFLFAVDTSIGYVIQWLTKRG